MKAKKILALLLTAIIVMSCTACTTEIIIELNNVPASNSGSVTPTPNQGSTETPTQGSSETPTQGSSETPSQGSTETPTQGSTETPTQGSDNAPSTGAPTSKADIVKMYCTAYNNISTASSITRTYDYTSNYNNILDIDGGNSTLQGIAGTLMDKFMVENTEALAVDHSALPPVGSTSINIDPNNIADAKCTDKGDYYEVVLTSTGTAANREVDSQPGSGSVGSFGPLLRSEDVSGAAAGFIEFEGLHSYYEAATVTAHITKDGKIIALEYLTPCILHFDAVKAVKIIKVGVCEIGLLFNQKYTIAY